MKVEFKPSKRYYIAPFCRRVLLFQPLLLLFLSLISICSYAQKQAVAGKVTDSLGNGLADVTVSVKGDGTAVKTNAEGHFSIMASKDAVLVVSHISYNRQEVSVRNGAAMIIVMQQAATDLGDVVVIGYGTSRKKDLTGAITQIKPDRVADDNPKTVQDVLRGLPGLTIGLDPSAKSGGTIRIRGQRSVYTDGGHNDPLLILDGMIFYGGVI